MTSCETVMTASPAPAPAPSPDGPLPAQPPDRGPAAAAAADRSPAGPVGGRGHDVASSLRPLAIDVGVPLALLADCIARLVGAYTLPVSTMVWLSTVLTLGAVGAGILAGGMAAAPIMKMIEAETAGR